MKVLIAGILTLAFSCSSPAQEQEQGIRKLPPKKVQRYDIRHTVVSASIFTVGYIFLRQSNVDKATAFQITLATTFLIGVAKEATDEKFDWDDMTMNMAGITVAALPILFIEF